MEKTTETKPTNRRRSQRRAARKTVKVECRQGAYGFGPNLTLKPLDLSDTGVRLLVAEAIEVLSEVEILIDGYGMKGSIKRVGTVRWLVESTAGTFCIGVEFQKRLPYRDWQNLVLPS
jgi:hypothetical protein